MARRVAITGVGMITPLGNSAPEVLERIAAGARAAAPPRQFDASPFACRVCAEIADFSPEQYIPDSDSKTIRLMNRDAQLAVAAAKLALEDAGIEIGKDYAGEDVALYGATGLAGVALEEVARLVRNSRAADGGLDLQRFGAVALKQVRPVLSFKILSNMPICFVSIFQGIQGPNGVYNPWEGHGAQAIVAGAQAVARGYVDCALVGGCDVKTHELGFIALHQEGVFRSWQEGGSGCVPGEAAAFLVLETEERARARGAQVNVTLANHRLGSLRSGSDAGELYRRILGACGRTGADAVVASSDGDAALRQCEESAFQRIGLYGVGMVRPKAHLGNAFAAAAAVQVGLAAETVRRTGARTLASCFGYGSEQAAFLLEGA